MPTVLLPPPTDADVVEETKQAPLSTTPKGSSSAETPHPSDRQPLPLSASDASSSALPVPPALSVARLEAGSTECPNQRRRRLSLVKIPVPSASSSADASASSSSSTTAADATTPPRPPRSASAVSAVRSSSPFQLPSSAALAGRSPSQILSLPSSSDVGIILADAAQNITHVNSTFESITGYSRTDSIGRNCIVKGTLVALADGTSVPIEAVLAGAEVLSYAAANLQEAEGLTMQRVDAVFDRGQRECVELLFADGRTLVCTADHRLRLADGDGHVVRAGGGGGGRGRGEGTEAGASRTHRLGDAGQGAGGGLGDGGGGRGGGGEGAGEDGGGRAAGAHVHGQPGSVDAEGGSDGLWVEAGALVVGQDEVAVGVEYPDGSVGAEGTGGWQLQLRRTLGYDLDMGARARHSLAFARVLGYALTDGCISDNTCKLYLGHRLDADAVQRDLLLLTGRQHTVQQHRRTLGIVVPRALVDAFKQEGAEAGKRLGKVSRFPAFLTDPRCPLPVVREFLGGLFGGDGKTVYVRHGSGGKLHGLGFCTSRTGDVAAEQQAVLQGELFALLSRCGVDCSDNVTPHFTTVAPNTLTKAGFDFKKLQSQGATMSPRRTVQTLNPKRSYTLGLDFSNALVTAFARCVGFRYCCHKQQRLSAAVAYFRGSERFVQQKQQLIARIVELRSARSSVSIPAAAARAKAELATREQLLPGIVAWKPIHATSLQSKTKKRGVSMMDQLELMSSRCFFSDPRTKTPYSAAKRRAELAASAATASSVKRQRSLTTPSSTSYVAATAHAAQRVETASTDSAAAVASLAGGSARRSSAADVVDLVSDEDGMEDEVDEEGEEYKLVDKVTYGVHKDSHVLPLFRVKLVGRRAVGLRHVYDLSVPNPQGEAYRSFVANGVVVHNCNFLQGKYTSPLARLSMRSSIARNETCHVAVLNYRKNGQPFWNRLTIAPMMDVEGRVAFYVGVQSPQSVIYVDRPMKLFPWRRDQELREPSSAPADEDEEDGDGERKGLVSSGGKAGNTLTVPRASGLSHARSMDFAAVRESGGRNALADDDSDGSVESPRELMLEPPQIVELTDGDDDRECARNDATHRSRTTSAPPSSSAAPSAPAAASRAAVESASRALPSLLNRATPVSFVAETLLPTLKGKYRVRAYKDQSPLGIAERREIMVIVYGDLTAARSSSSSAPASAIPLRVHDQCQALTLTHSSALYPPAHRSHRSSL